MEDNENTVESTSSKTAGETRKTEKKFSMGR